MRKPQVPAEEQYRLIMECRQSGLSDYRWCNENDICPGTFYNWVTRLRKKGCEIPEPVGIESFLPTPQQEVVRVDIIPESPCIDPSPRSLPCPDVNTVLSASMTLKIGDASLMITNDANPALLSQVIQILQGSSC